MGGSLSSPITTMHVERHRSLAFNAACCHVQGWRPTQEDAHNIIDSINSSGIMLFGVYDGHGGPLASQYLQQAIPNAFKSVHSLQDYEQITNLMLDLDADFIAKQYQDGTTCCIVLAQLWDIIEDVPITIPMLNYFQKINFNTDILLKKTAIKILSINIGDSRAMVITSNAAYQNTLFQAQATPANSLPLTPGAMKRRPEYIAITRDHKPQLEAEHQRIVNAMGTVSSNRVDGSLALSRAIGDAPFKANNLLSPTQQKVIAVPDYELHTIYWGDSLLVCCDGIFESERMTYSEVSRVVCRSIQDNINLTKLISPIKDGSDAAENAPAKVNTQAINKFAQDSIDDTFRCEYADWDPAVVARDLIEQSLLGESKDNNTAIVINFRLPKPFQQSTATSTSASSPLFPDQTALQTLQPEEIFDKFFLPHLLDFLPKIECIPGPYNAVASNDAEWATTYQKDLASNGYTMDDVKEVLDILDNILARYAQDAFEPVKAQEITSKIIETYNQERSKMVDIATTKNGTNIDLVSTTSTSTTPSTPSVQPLLLKNHLFSKRQDTSTNINLDMVFHHILRAGAAQRPNASQKPF